jgi:phage tail sheath gpL-like
LSGRKYHTRTSKHDSGDTIAKAIAAKITAAMKITAGNMMITMAINCKTDLWRYCLLFL